MPLKYLAKWLVATAVLYFSLSMASANGEFSGRWKIDTDRSTALDPWRSLEIEIAVENSKVSIVRYYGGGSRVAQESMSLDTSITSQTVEVEGWWENRHIGAYSGNGKKQTVSAKWLDKGRTLQLNIEMVLESSQGSSNVRALRELRLSRDGKTLTEIQLRSSRNLPTVRVFNRL